MDKKTIGYLNSKMWYRLLKVFFGFVILATLLIFNWGLIDVGVKRLDDGKTLINCKYGEKLKFTPKQIGLNFSTSDFKGGFDYRSFFEGYNDYEIKQIFKNCYVGATGDFDVFATQKIYEVWGDSRLGIKKEERPPLTEAEIKSLDEILPKIEATYINSDKARYLDFSVQLFDIQPVYNYLSFLWRFLVWNLAIFLIAEILRRIFYYIILGSVRPEKQ